MDSNYWYEKFHKLTTTTTTLFDAGAWTEWDLFIRSWFRSCLWWAHPVFNFSGHRHESLFNVCCVLCTSLQEWNAKRVSEFLHKKVYNIVEHHGNEIDEFSLRTGRNINYTIIEYVTVLSNIDR